jgi:hypothetical protein
VHHRIGLGLLLPAAISCLLAGSPSLAAQDAAAPDSTAPDTTVAVTTKPKPAMGASVDRFIYEGSGITAVSFRYSGLKPGTLGTEIGASIFPDAIDFGALVLAPDIGAAYDFSGDGFDLLLKAGLSALTAVGVGFAFQPGYHFGSGLLIRTGKASGVRLDVVRHTYLIEQESEGIWSVGLGFTSLPRKVKP